MYKSSASVPDSLVAYTKEIHEATQRITPAEEKELGAKTQEAIRLQNIYSSLEEELGREPTEEEWCAASDGVDSVEELRATIVQGMEAKNRLVESNLRMVQGVVNTYIRNGLGSQYNAGDLMQEGTMVSFRLGYVSRTVFWLTLFVPIPQTPPTHLSSSRLHFNLAGPYPRC